VRSAFFVGLIPCAFSHALCLACALVSAAVLGRLIGLPFGVDILITRDIRLAPAGRAGELTNFRTGCRARRTNQRWHQTLHAAMWRPVRRAPFGCAPGRVTRRTTRSFSLDQSTVAFTQSVKSATYNPMLHTLHFQTSKKSIYAHIVVFFQ
jgi:hypothetical protein